MTPAVRVGYVLRAFPRLSETFILNEILSLRAIGVDVRIAALEQVEGGRRHPEAERLMPEVTWLSTGARRPRRRRGPLVPPGAEARWAAAGESWAPALRAWGVTHVHAHFAGPAATAAAFAAEAAGASYSFTAHAKDIFSERVNWEWVAPLGERAGAVVTVCDYNKRFLRRRMPGARIERIYNGVDPSFWRPAGRRRAAGPVVAVGRLVRKKGFHVLLDAIARLRDRGMRVPVVIVGEGAERGSLERQALALGLGRLASFAGACTQDEVRAILRRASLVALPCVVDHDGNQDALPTVLLEAGACAVPAVATRVAGVPEIVLHGRTGLVVEPDDARALAAAIRRLTTAPALRTRLGASAREHVVRRFDPAAAARRLARLFAGATAGAERWEACDADRAAVR